jgi:hypothetical protein
MTSEREVFFVQMAEVDTEAPDSPALWTTQCLFSYEDRAQAEHCLALLEPLLNPSAGEEMPPHMRERVEQWLREKEAEDEARMTLLDRLQRRVDRVRYRLYVYLVDPPQSVERIFRVVSSTELRSESKDALRHAEQAASLGTWRRSDERDEGDDDA